MKRETLIVMVKLVLDTDFENFEGTAHEIRDKLKMKMVDSKGVELLEAVLIGCIAPDGFTEDKPGAGLVN